VIKKYKHSLQDDIGYWLSRLRIKVHSSFEAKLISKGISIPQWRIIIGLYNNDASSIVELAKFIEIDKGSISRVVDKLESMGFVIRQEGKDRRSGNIRLSKKGEQLAPELAKLAELNEKEFFSPLSMIEVKQLQNILKKLLQHAGIHSLGGWLSNEKK
jgi:DNA-binding MarR family transcriptional regulator